ncbi:MAG: (d)CMP kinase [Lachnoanaerobaculum sp.]|jgi:cytidylate kinase|uniref:(d)CMP kinase n=1 Tax=Lachnoanaerobaculum TaxID=1164882 RepID=UPI00028257E6|nr:MULTISPECIES: (d)CMP kinase [unclassified Lachnoanaerobaculum]EJZ70234.1 cytidylate kinase [Lachnoanaerobaculum sp. OBRC5-5]MBF1260528.1 (d)CMP kinase [Lachnoanaerobaculum sp.]GMO02053.1 (d)CMP kinase [Lachnoanaerobaculum sp. JCM 36186]
MNSIAIDGPAGAGKSSIAKALSKRLGYIYIDTGAMYRAVALFFLENNVADGTDSRIESLLDKLEISIKYEDGAQKVILNGEDVTGKLRLEEIGKLASKFSAIGSVREKLVALQRKLAQKENVVMDGRDIGTVVLPNADLKIYLSASSKVRAKRRYLELLEKGQTDLDINDIEDEIIKRDEADMNREISPLKQADDAYYLDSSDMTLEEVVSKILSMVKEER